MSYTTAQIPCSTNVGRVSASERYPAELNSLSFFLYPVENTSNTSVPATTAAGALKFGRCTPRNPTLVWLFFASICDNN